MKGNNAFATIGISDFASFKSRPRKTAEVYYKAVVSPNHPGIGKPIFSATRHLYFGTKETFSVIGQYFTDEVGEIISFVIDRSLTDGTHEVGGFGSSVAGLMTMSHEILYAKTGTIEFARKHEEGIDSITATFNFEIEHRGQTYRVSEGKLFVVASGPLQVL